MEQNKRVNKVSAIKAELEATIAEVRLAKDNLENQVAGIKIELNMLEARHIALNYSVSVINRINGKKQ